MNSNIFIPKQINVGFQRRSDTYTGKLAYIIYFDEKNKLRKETSWNSWRNKDVPNIIYDNEPTEGFVLNKHVGGYSSGWNHRNSYIRIYDPRNFEFEISVENLLYILENCTSEKGKGLIGKFVYGWEGKELILIPCDSPDYKEIQEYNKIVHENLSIKAKELIIGATYKTKDNIDLAYMGKFDYYGYSDSNGEKRFWFYDRRDRYCHFETMKTIPKNKLIHVADSNCCNDYADLFDELECYYCYSPVDKSKVEYEDYNLEYFKEIINNKILLQDYWWSEVKVYCDLEDNPKTLIKIKRKDREKPNLLQVTKKSVKIEKYKSYWREECKREVEYDEIIIESEDVEEIFNKLRP